MGSWKRRLHLLHRWLGIGAGWLVLLWFGSGVVMMYLPYPALTEQERMAWLAPLDAGQVKVGAWDAWRATAKPGVPEAVRLNSVARRSAYHFMADGRWNAAAAGSEMPTSGDHYYYSHHRRAAFPVMRARFQPPDETTFYVDAVQGQLTGHADRDGKWNRWLFNGPHQLDFASVLRTRPVWDVMVVSLCVLGAVLSMTGLVLGWRRLRKRVARPPGAAGFSQSVGYPYTLAAYDISVKSLAARLVTSLGIVLMTNFARTV